MHNSFSAGRLTTVAAITALLAPTFALQATENKYQLGVGIEIPNGGDLSIDDDPLYGIDGKYFFKQLDNQRSFVSGGYRTDLDKTGTAFDSLSVEIGGQYDLAHFWNSRAYAEYSAGIAYSQEEYSIELIDRKITETSNHLGYKASLGLGLEVNKQFNGKLFINQLGSPSGTSFGVGFGYAF